MYVVALTGASGSILGIRLIEELLAAGKNVSGIASESSWDAIRHEIFHNGEKPSSLKDILRNRKCSNLDKLTEYENKDFFSPLASGTVKFDAIIVIPCSMKTLSAAANGYAETLINRVVDVAQKENRKCILVPRETPLSLVHIENLSKAKQAGADILLPVPSFYTFPETIDDVINFIVGKTLNLLNIEHKLFSPWAGNSCA